MLKLNNNSCLRKSLILLGMLLILFQFHQTSQVKGEVASLTGYVLYSDKPITEKTNEIPEFKVRNNENQELFGGDILYDNQTGRYEIQGIQSGDYSITILIDTAEPFNNYQGYADDYDGYHWSVIIPSNQEVVEFNLSVMKVIHLTSPIDNSEAINHTIRKYNATELEFEWVPIPEAQWYIISIRRYAQPFEYIERVCRTETMESSIKPYLPPSEETEIYSFEMSARNAEGTWVGKFMIGYIDGYGGDYRFRRDSSAMYFGNLLVNVEDEKGNRITGASIVVRSKPDGKYEFVEKSNLLGPTEFKGIVAESYEIMAEKIEYEQGFGAAIVFDNETTEVTIKLSKITSSIEILVKDSDGEPISDVNVESTAAPSDQMTMSGMTDEDGQISFENIEPGEYMFVAEKSGYETNGTSLTVAPGETMRKSIVLSEKTEQEPLEQTGEETAGGGGIPGFPIESVIGGSLISLLILHLHRRNQV